MKTLFIFLTQSRIIPSYQGDSIIFHDENFLQLQGIVLPHTPFCRTKDRAHTKIYANLANLELFSSHYVAVVKAVRGIFHNTNGLYLYLQVNY